MRHKTPNILTQTYCVYCQRDFKAPAELQGHVAKKHLGTYTAGVIASATLAHRIDPGFALAQDKGHSPRGD